MAASATATALAIKHCQRGRICLQAHSLEASHCSLSSIQMHGAAFTHAFQQLYQQGSWRQSYQHHNHILMTSSLSIGHLSHHHGLSINLLSHCIFGAEDWAQDLLSTAILGLTSTKNLHVCSPVWISTNMLVLCEKWHHLKCWVWTKWSCWKELSCIFSSSNGSVIHCLNWTSFIT